MNRAAYFAGGRLKARLASTGENYSVELWFWNGLPNDVRPITGHLLSLRSAGTSEHVGINGIADTASHRAVFSRSAQDPEKVLTGKTEIAAQDLAPPRIGP